MEKLQVSTLLPSCKIHPVFIPLVSSSWKSISIGIMNTIIDTTVIARLYRTSTGEIMNQHGITLWFTGLPSSGKTTLAGLVGNALKAMGLPVSMFTVLFAVARTVGWISQWSEMIEDPQQKIGRPRQLYTGVGRRDYVPIDKRK